MPIALAKPQDIEQLVTLVNSAYRGDASRQGWTTEADLLGGQRVDPAMLADVLGSGRVTVLVLREQDDGPITGCVSVEPGQDGAWALGMLSIDPSRQAGGLGRRLLDAAETFARTRGATHMRITVIHARHALLAWYGRRGYRATGAIEPFPYGDERFGQPLRDDLHFLVLEKPLSQPAPGSA